jgi:hypothetical protein
MSRGDIFARRAPADRGRIQVASGASGPFSPASLSPALWLDGRETAYSDTAGTVPVVSPTGRVRRVNQPAPLTGSWLAPSDAARSFREGTTAVDLQGVPTGQWLVQPAGITMPADDATLAFAITNHDNYPNVFQAFASGTDGVSRWGLVLFNGNILIYRNGAFWNTAIAVTPNKTFVGVVRWRTNARDISYVRDGVPGSSSEAGAIPTGRVVSVIDTGSAAGEGCHVTIGQLLGIGRSVSDAERDDLLTWLQANAAPAQAPLNTPQVAIAGDSIAVGFNTANGRRGAWAFKMLANLYTTAAARLRNTSVSGYTLAQMATAYPTDIVPIYSASRAKNVLVVAGATNSIAFGALTAAQVIAAYWSYCDTARAAGWLVVACTVLPRSDATIRGTFNADRATVNAAILADWATHADGLADVAAVAGMGADGDSANAANYGDLVHPTDAGHTLLEPTYRAAVIALL